ncbi:unnamed protein product [Ilex paraguariensis]|uniref:Uncharacterized protein n=1 Tax=Ilex paraguariensis TaxID=185542 RepID=A0ABC8RWW7_9AQUA
MSQIEVDDMVETLGYKKDTGYTVYCMLPDADSEDGLRPLASYNDVLNMFACYEGNDIISLYVVTLQINKGRRGISIVGDKSDTPTFDYEFNTEYISTLCDGLPDTVEIYTNSFDDLSYLDLLYFYDGVPDGVHTPSLENRSRVDKGKSKIGEECSGVGRGNSFDRGKDKLNDCLSDEDNDHLYNPLNSDDDVINVSLQPEKKGQSFVIQSGERVRKSINISGSGLPPPSGSAIGLRGLTIIKNLECTNSGCPKGIGMLTRSKMKKNDKNPIDENGKGGSKGGEWSMF